MMFNVSCEVVDGIILLYVVAVVFRCWRGMCYVVCSCYVTLFAWHSMVLLVFDVVGLCVLCWCVGRLLMVRTMFDALLKGCSDGVLIMLYHCWLVFIVSCAISQTCYFLQCL